MALSDRLYKSKLPVKTFDAKKEIEKAVKQVVSERKPEVKTTKKPVEKQAVSTLPILDKKKTTAPAYGTKGYLVNAKGEKIKATVNPVAVGLTKVASFGTSSMLPGMKEAEQQAQTQFPKSYVAGQILGYAAPTGLATNVTKGLVKGATRKLASTTAKRVVEGAIVGTTAEATQIVKPLLTKEITPTEAGKQLATGLVAGAGIDVGIGVLGKLGKDLATKVKLGKPLSQAEKLQVEKAISEVGGNVNKTVDKTNNIVKPLLKETVESTEQAIPKTTVSIPKDDMVARTSVTEKQIVKPLVDIPTSQATESPTQIVNPLIEQQPEQIVKPLASEIQRYKTVAESAKSTDGLTIPVDEQAKQSFRRTTENSIQNSELPDDLKEAVKGQTYDVITNEESWNRAWDKVSNDLEGTKARLIAKQDLSGADDTMEYIALLNKTSKSNIAEAKQLATDFAEKSTRSGQAIQAISALQKMTPEGQLVRAMSVKNAGERELKNINPTAFNNFKKLDDEITKSVKQAKKEIADETLNKITDEVELLKDEVSGKTIAKKHDKKTRTPEQVLADKIKNALKPKGSKEIDEINQMVSSLFSKAKPKLGIENKPSQAIDKFRIDIKNRQQYAKVWQDSKSILSGELSSDMIEQIDDYFKTGVRPTFKESQLKALMKSTMKDLDINLSDIVKKFASDQITDRNIIKETLLKELNLDNESAKYLSKFIEKNLKDSIKEKREKLLANYFKDFKEKIPTDQSKKIQDIVNLGGLENKKYVDAFKNKLPSVVKQLLKDRNIKMIDILKLTREAQGNVTDDMVNEFLRGLNVDVKYYDQIKNAADDAFKELSDKTRQSYINKLTKEQTKRVERPLREKISELYNLDVLNDLAREKYKLPYFTDDEAKYIVDTMEKASTLKGREKDLLLAKVDQLISDKVPVSLADKVKAIRNMSLLGNIKTIGVRNPLGNLIFSGLENVAQIPSGITDTMVSKILKTDRTTKVLPSLSAQAKGLKKGVLESWEDVINNIDTSPTRGGAELPRNRKVFETAWLNKANNWMGDALKFGDRPFYQAAYDARLKELKELSPNADIEDLKKLAHEFGLERTFQNSSTTSKAVGMIKKGLNLGKDFGLGDIIMPYTQTPANILEKGVQYTPLNIINVFGKIGGQALGKETIRNNPKAFADAVGRTFTGTGAIALGYKLAEEGNMTGGTADMSTKEKAIRKEAGEQQYSVKIGDKWYSFDWAQPASIPLAIGVDMYNAGIKKEDVASKLQAGTESGIQTLFNQSMLQGISRLFGGTSIASGYAESLANVPSQFTPTLLSQTAQVIDPYKRDSDYSNVKTIAKTSVQKKIPGLRQQLPPTLNLFGEPVKEQGQGITKAIKVFLSPSNVSDVNTDKITNEIYSLYKRTGETDVIPSKIPIGLTNNQKYEFKKVFGKKVKRALEQTMRGNYSSATDNDKIKIIRRVINSAYDEAKNELGIGIK